MKKVFILVITLSFFISCKGQNKNSNKEVITETQLDSIKPKTNISVKKEYDQDGNLIKIDSSYSYFYSNIKGDTILENEIFKKFKLSDDSRAQSIDSLFNSDFFGNSPFKMNEFYTDDFFQNSYDDYRKRQEAIFKMMDSIKNNFYKKQFIIPPVEEK